jgi:predicted phosphodiesterase
MSLQSTLEFLKGICGDVRVVQGDFDDFESPEQLVRPSSCAPSVSLLFLGLGLLPSSCCIPTLTHILCLLLRACVYVQVLQIADFKVGVCHGHQVVPWGDKEALAILQRQMGVDILVTGHTHEFKARSTAAAAGSSAGLSRRSPADSRQHAAEVQSSQQLVG